MALSPCETHHLAARTYLHDRLPPHLEDEALSSAMESSTSRVNSAEQGDGFRKGSTHLTGSGSTHYGDGAFN
jgi:hypothetical protein